MGKRWTTQQVVDLAPDGKSVAAARRLTSPRTWSQLGCTPSLVWGRCQGSAKQPYQVTVDLTEPAGHCTNISSSWYGANNVYLGYRVHSYFPGRDHGIVRYNSSVSRPGNVYLYNGSYRDITGAGNAYVNQYIYRSGSTTGLRGGYVQALNQTVNYAEGSVYGLIKTNACAEGGDSGGSMFAGNTALGMTSGGSGNCTWGGTTYFEPVKRALSYYGVSVY